MKAPESNAVSASQGGAGRAPLRRMGLPSQSLSRLLSRAGKLLPLGVALDGEPQAFARRQLDGVSIANDERRATVRIDHGHGAFTMHVARAADGGDQYELVLEQDVRLSAAGAPLVSPEQFELVPRLARPVVERALWEMATATAAT